MKKTRNLILGIVLLLGAGGLTLGSIRSGDSLAAPKLRTAIFGLAFVGGWLLGEVFIYKKSESIEKDELTKKVGYASLALSAQIICLLGGLVFLINAFYPFLEQYTAFDAMMLTINGMVLINFFSYLYFSKHPDKTGI